MDAEVEDKITYITFLTQPNRIVFGSKEGFITIWNITKGLVSATKDEALNSFKMPPKTMQKVVQIIELPSKIAVSKKHVYYILTAGNLFAMSKSNHEILQVFYKGERAKVNRPRLLQIGVLVMEN